MGGLDGVDVNCESVRKKKSKSGLDEKERKYKIVWTGQPSETGWQQ